MTRGLALLAGVLGLAMTAGCTSNSLGPSGRCADGTKASLFGDPALPIQLQLGQLKYVKQEVPSQQGLESDVTVSASFQPLADGDTLDLRLPPEGGMVAWVGAQATNLDGCITIRGSLIDDSGTVVATEQRETTLIPVPGRPGWGEPDPFHFDQWANVPVCPVFSGPDRIGRAYTLSVTIIDDAGRQATASAVVTPTCADEDPGRNAECQCECLAGYMLGKCVARDGGP